MSQPFSNSNPPPVDLNPPPIRTYASQFPGSPEEQAYQRQQYNAKQQSILNNKHSGGRRNRRRKSHGGATATGDDAPGWIDPDNPAWHDPDDPPPSWIPIPQSDTGIHQAGPDTANTASLKANTSLIGGRAASQYDSLVQFTPSMGQPLPGGSGTGSASSSPSPSIGGRRRRRTRRKKRRPTRRRRHKARKKKRRTRRQRKKSRRRRRRGGVGPSGLPRKVGDPRHNQWAATSQNPSRLGPFQEYHLDERGNPVAGPAARKKRPKSATKLGKTKGGRRRRRTRKKRKGRRQTRRRRRRKVRRTRRRRKKRNRRRRARGGCGACLLG
jgi:hypothetical protein